LSHGRTRNPASAKLNLVDLVNYETHFLANFLQETEAPLPPVAKSEIGSDINFLQMEQVPKDVRRKIAGPYLSKLTAERNDNRQIDSEGCDGFKLLFQCLYLARRVIRRKNLERVGVESKHRRRAADFLRPLYNIAKQALVAYMHPVEIADRCNRFGENTREILKTTEYFHVGIYILILLVLAMNFIRNS